MDACNTLGEPTAGEVRDLYQVAYLFSLEGDAKACAVTRAALAPSTETNYQRSSTKLYVITPETFTGCSPRIVGEKRAP